MRGENDVYESVRYFCSIITELGGTIHKNLKVLPPYK
jgi:hypothetical protein